MASRRPRTRQRRRRRTIRKRSRRYRTKRSNVVADGTYTEKLTYETELYVANNQATMACHWTRSGNSSGEEVFPVGNNTGNNQFGQCQRMFKEYLITGMKIEYRPYSFQGQTDTILKSVTCGTVMDVFGAFAVPAPTNTFRQALDAKQYDPMRPFKRFYRIAGWFKGKGYGWRDCTEAQNNAYGNGQHDCVTCLALDTFGFPDASLIGAVRTTYYVKFRSRQPDA